MSNILHYRGNVDIDPTQIMGPDLHGAYYRPVEASYDPEAHMTTVTLQPGSFQSLSEQIAAAS